MVNTQRRLAAAAPLLSVLVACLSGGLETGTDPASAGVAGPDARSRTADAPMDDDDDAGAFPGGDDDAGEDADGLAMGGPTTLPDAAIDVVDAVDAGGEPDTDTDGDGVVDSEDQSPTNPNGCGDSDADTCDDCTRGHFAPDDDGLDTNGDGICDACDVAICGAQGACEIEAGKAVCRCNPGWTGDTCRVDVDECTVADNPCRDGGDDGAVCTNTRGRYICTCSDDGFSVRDGVCQRPDVCVDNDNPCDDGDDPDATCTVTDEGYRCGCSGSGFSEVSGACRNVDECVRDDNPCNDGDDPDAACNDTTGSYTCSCSGAGFEASSGTCVAVGGCTVVDGDDPCDDAGDTGASCGESDGGVSMCGCSPGVGGLRCDTFHPSCQAILQAGLAAGDGMYVIDPFGGSPFQVTCDMTTEGGGWTGVTAALARGGFRASMTSLADGMCDLNGDNPRARSRIETVICRYDIDLGFEFEQLRLVEGQVIVRSDSSDPGELAYNDGAWGTADCVSGDSGEGATGDLRFGAASNAAGALSLGAQRGLAACSAVQQHNSGTVLSWSGQTTVAPGTVLRLELSESGGVAAEGWEWTAGTVFVR